MTFGAMTAKCDCHMSHKGVTVWGLDLRYKPSRWADHFQTILCLPAIMAESTESIPLHPVAPRLKDGPKTPHLGPDIDSYRAAHALTIAEDSDEWWAKVCTTNYPSASGPST